MLLIPCQIHFCAMMCHFFTFANIELCSSSSLDDTIYSNSRSCISMHSGCWQVVRGTSRRSMVWQHHWYSMRASSCGYRVGSDVSRHILQLSVLHMKRNLISLVFASSSSSSRAFMSFHLMIQASKKLHDDMTHAVLCSKICFFDTNPLGRLLNRFSSDVGSNDDQLPTSKKLSFRKLS